MSKEFLSSDRFSVHWLSLRAVIAVCVYKFKKGDGEYFHRVHEGLIRYYFFLP